MDYSSRTFWLLRVLDAFWGLLKSPKYSSNWMLNTFLRLHHLDRLDYTHASSTCRHAKGAKMAESDVGEEKKTRWPNVCIRGEHLQISNLYGRSRSGRFTPVFWIASKWGQSDSDLFQTSNIQALVLWNLSRNRVTLRKSPLARASSIENSARWRCHCSAVSR